MQKIIKAIFHKNRIYLFIYILEITGCLFIYSYNTGLIQLHKPAKITKIINHSIKYLSKVHVPILKKTE